MTQLEMWTGETKYIPGVLKVGNTGKDLTNSSVTAILKDELQGTRVQITCNKGAVIDGVTAPESAGGYTIPISITDSAKAGLYKILTKVVTGNEVEYFPSVNPDTINIKEAI